MQHSRRSLRADQSALLLPHKLIGINRAQSSGASPVIATIVRGAVAGVAATAVWVAAEPIGQRAFRTRYSDVRLLGALLTTRTGWRPIGIALHLANGAIFGSAFARMGGRGWRHGLLAAELENLLLWPAMAVMDRIHPDRRRGVWPPLVTSPQIFAYEVTMHALFGVVLGLLLPQRMAGFDGRDDEP